MSKKFSFYLVKDDGTVEGTDSSEIAEAASADGTSVVINVAACTATYDSDVMSIPEADPADWIDDEGEGEGDDE